MSYLDREPGLYDDDGANAALVDQQRAATLDGVRSSEAISITYRTGADYIHWAIYRQPDEEAPQFLTYVLVRAWRDAQAALNCSHDELAELVEALIEKGVGE